jgi:hypothetical protein
MRSYRRIYLDHGVLPFHVYRNPIMYMYTASKRSEVANCSKKIPRIYSKETVMRDRHKDHKSLPSTANIFNPTNKVRQTTASVWCPSATNPIPGRHADRWIALFSPAEQS